MTAKSAVAVEKTDKIPPRERILTAAAGLFYRNGIRAVGVDAIAEAAGTNKMTLYRHFSSKDELVAEYLRRLAEQAKSSWDKLEADHPGDAPTQLRAWLSVILTSLINCWTTRSGPILSILSTCRSTAAGSAMSKPR